VAAPARDTPSLTDSLQGLLRELPGLFSDRVELLSLELHRAGIALTRIVALVLVAAILAATAWLLLWAAAVAMLVLVFGLHWAAALLLVLLLNLCGAVLALAQARRLTGLLALPATRRHLTVATEPAAAPPAEPAAGGADARAAA